jgi:RHS repeat-associated protein
VAIARYVELRQQFTPRRLPGRGRLDAGRGLHHSPARSALHRPHATGARRAAKRESRPSPASACRAECASRKKFVLSGRVAFVLAAQAVNVPQENAFTYGEGVSGAMHQHWNREYNARQGRYIESDPIGLAGGHQHLTYGFNQPNLVVDLNGLRGMPFRPPVDPFPLPPLAYADPLTYKNGGQPINMYPSGSQCLRGPDFVNFQVDAYVFSVWGTFTRDGNSFFGGGLNLSLTNPLSVSGATVVGWLNRSTVNPGNSNNFAGGYSGAAAAAFMGTGGGLMYSPGIGSATVVGMGGGYMAGAKPKSSAGGSGGYSFDMGKTGLRWSPSSCSCPR